MSYVIDKEVCNACGSCASVCPTEAISEAGGKYEISADDCIGCGICVGECPTDAIKEA